MIQTEDTITSTLETLKEEIRTILNRDQQNPSKLIEYIIGKSKPPYVHTISVDYKELASFKNINNARVSPTKANGESFNIPQANLPKRCVYINFIPGNNTTLELYLDRGWELTFKVDRETIVAGQNLEIDIQVIGMPVAIMNMNCVWVK